MNDTTVTVVGNVVDSPRRVRLDNGAVTNFRMASTARRYDARQQEFASFDELQVGRDYITGDAAFDSVDTDLPREPAHA